MIAGRKLNLAFLMLVIRLVDGRKGQLGARRPGGGKKGIKSEEEDLAVKEEQNQLYILQRNW